MKNLIYGTLMVLFSASLGFAQNRTLPSVEVKTLDGDVFNMQKVENKGNPIVISFWATWCKPCKKELNNIAEVYEDWQDETGVKLIAISIDDTRSMSKVAPYTFLLNGKNEIVWQHRGYMEGDEDELLEQIEKIAN